MQTSVFSIFPAILLGALSAGCTQSDGWDTEYVCTGQEQSSAHFLDSDPASSTHKGYPLTIDFHLRSNTVMVKSAQVAVDASSEDALRFSSKNKGFWINGQFDKRDGQLTVVEERTLGIAGRTQQIRTTGQYVCNKIADNDRTGRVRLAKVSHPQIDGQRYTLGTGSTIWAKPAL